MFAMLAVAMAMTTPAAEAGMASRIEDSVSDEVLESGLVGMWYEAFVAPDGTIQDCTVRAVLGDLDAAQAVCRKVVGRRAKPATGADGRPTYGFLRGKLDFADNYKPIPLDAVRPDLALTVAGNIAKAERVVIVVAVDAAGQIAACEGGEGAPGLTRTACDQAKSLVLPVRTAKSGEAVGYLYPMIVEFRADRG